MGSMLMGLAPLTTTGVGSLPFTRPAEAARHALGAYELPFCPQLPRAFGDMLHEWLGADPGRCGWAPDRDRQLPAVWDDFILQLTRRPPSHGVVKLQVTGPLTLAMAIERGRGTGRRGRRSGGSGGRDLGLAGGGGQRPGARAGRARAHRAGHDRRAGPDGGTAGGRDPGGVGCAESGRPGVGGARLRRGSVASGGRRRARRDLLRPRSLRLRPDAQTAIRRLMRRGGRIMWGAVDPGAVEPPPWTVALVRAAARAVAGRRWRTMDVLDASLLSGSCRTRGVDEEAERELASALGVAASGLRGGPLPARPAREPTRS